ncbi:MAG: hypothetical protein ACRDPH_10265 [Marmoricola sp.]
MSMMNTQVVRSEVRYRIERHPGPEDDWARIEGWRGSRIRRSRHRRARHGAES